VYLALEIETTNYGQTGKRHAEHILYSLLLTVGNLASLYRSRGKAIVRLRQQ
jgi:hypothetical protein